MAWPFKTIPSDQAQGYTISKRIKHLLAFTFGKRGSRHSTEGYFLSIDLQDIQQRFYHIQTDPISLCLKSSDKHCLLVEFMREKNSDSSALGAIVLTSVFERNMYRYREPRTFRTFHMDVGHILATIEMLGQEFHFKTRIHFNFNEDAILQQIGASLLDAGVMTIVTLHEETC